MLEWELDTIRTACYISFFFAGVMLIGALPGTIRSIRAWKHRRAREREHRRQMEQWVRAQMAKEACAINYIRFPSRITVKEARRER